MEQILRVEDGKYVGSSVPKQASYEITIPTSGYTSTTVSVWGVSKTLQKVRVSTDKNGNALSLFTSGMKEDYPINLTGSAGDFGKLYSYEIVTGAVDFYFTSAPTTAFNVLIREAV